MYELILIVELMNQYTHLLRLDIGIIFLTMPRNAYCLQ